MTPALESELERACKLLELATPEAMEASASALDAVARGLSEWRGTVSPEQVKRLRATARRARLLLQLAAQFHSRWHNILAGMAAGYTAQGTPANLESRRRISVSG